MHRRDFSLVPIEIGRHLAEHIPGATFTEWSGADGALWTEHADEIQDQIEEFLTGVRHAGHSGRALATLLLADIVDSTDRAATLGDKAWKTFLDRFDRDARDIVGRFGGQLVKTMGDGILATFDGPTRAFRAASALGKAVAQQGIQMRFGLHAGEVEQRAADLGGLGVHIAARVASLAMPGEILCSRTVKDLAAGSEFVFQSKGLHTLRGVPDEWELFAVGPAN